MDTQIVEKMIVMKRAQLASVVSDFATSLAQLNELNARLTHAKYALQNLEASKQMLENDISMLSEAISQNPDQSVIVSNQEPTKNDQYCVKITDADGVRVYDVDLKALDLSDGEPKVRQHTIEVRRRAVLVTLKRGPLSTSELIEAFKVDGFLVSDENEVANLSAILSRTSFFSSVGRRWLLDTGKLLEARKMPN